MGYVSKTVVHAEETGVGSNFFSVWKIAVIFEPESHNYYHQ
jgi:hypothetical protein